MHVYLQQHPVSGESPRYVRLTLQADLFGGWELMHESGQLGGQTQCRREHYLLQNEATAAFEKARDSRLKRGFRATATTGAETAGR